MDNNQAISPKKNKALIIIIIVSLLVIFMIAVSLLMAKNTLVQKNNTPETADDKLREMAANIPAATEEKAIEKAKLIEAQAQAAATASQTENTASIAVGEPAPANSLDSGDEHRNQDTININVGNGAFTPLSFTVPIGAKINLSLTSTDKQAHTLTFNDPTLDRNNITVEAGQTRSSILKTPTTPGTYAFSCATPGHADKGEIGKMIVQ